MGLFITKVRVKYKNEHKWSNSEVHQNKMFSFILHATCANSNIFKLDLMFLLQQLKCNLNKVYLHDQLLFKPLPLCHSLYHLDSSNGTRKGCLYNKCFHSVFIQSEFLIPAHEDLHVSSSTLLDIYISE